MFIKFPFSVYFQVSFSAVPDALANVLAAGAIQSAVLLLRSGLANKSDQLGRNFMNHNSSAILALSPFRLGEQPNIRVGVAMITKLAPL